MAQGKLDYSYVERFERGSIPEEVEDELLGEYAKFSLDGDMVWSDLAPFFEDLQLPAALCRLVRRDDVVLEGTVDVIDFSKIIRLTYHLLVFMDNESVINEFWSLLVGYSGRDVQFPHVELQNHILSVKDLQKVGNLVNEDSGNIIGMLSCATRGTRVYMTYLDFANVLGKLGYLRF
ncbi:Rad33p KNAG_0B03620 [Huiozyma naganishii CBS 8797]|uniref:DNA repair protein RAD33 n=1 Tax=Huiozyma naganishii (strain ATCC MYA-139 / BCRC 22969 / CBS 8797 / KCTC 17520 / NBRC 10181 / NCYC 3082 / Yp74L-3) TaxID=1071383 RepID=J7S3M3_HUIN7|nr:hypothetical protein KNAG_0B03620 [Kazachstania naganishii CBS 8797]CCK68804.1 hypothetical protein KNAG_0B03620 [Kazachstania naganishii CBS 8797]